MKDVLSDDVLACIFRSHYGERWVDTKRKRIQNPRTCLLSITIPFKSTYFLTILFLSLYTLTHSTVVGFIAAVIFISERVTIELIQDATVQSVLWLQNETRVDCVYGTDLLVDDQSCNTSSYIGIHYTFIMQSPTSNKALEHQQNIDFDSLLEKQRELLKQIREGPEDADTKFGVNLGVHPASPPSTSRSTSAACQQQQETAAIGIDVDGPIVAHGWTFERVRPPPLSSDVLTNTPSSTAMMGGKKSKKQRRQEREEAEEWISNWHFARIPTALTGCVGQTTFVEEQPDRKSSDITTSSNAVASGNSIDTDEGTADDCASRSGDTPEWFFQRVPTQKQKHNSFKTNMQSENVQIGMDGTVSVPSFLLPNDGIDRSGDDDDDNDITINNTCNNIVLQDDDDRDAVMELIMDVDRDENDAIIDGIDDSMYHHAVSGPAIIDGLPPYQEDDHGIAGLDEAAIPDDISLEDLVDDDYDDDDYDDDDDVEMTVEDEGLPPPQYLEELKHRQDATIQHLKHPHQLDSAANSIYGARYDQQATRAIQSYGTSEGDSNSPPDEDDVVMGHGDDRIGTPNSSSHKPTSWGGGSNKVSAVTLTQSNLSPTSVMAMNGASRTSVPQRGLSVSLSSSSTSSSSSGNSVRLPCAEGMDEMFKNTLQKLTESMKRSAKSRQSLLIKTEHTQEYGRILCVNQILRSVQSSSRQVDTCLEMYRMPPATIDPTEQTSASVSISTAGASAMALPVNVTVTLPSPVPSS
jgi:hypothetical protein